MNNSRDEIIKKINNCFCRMDQADLQELLDSINGLSDQPQLIPDWILLKEAKKEIGQLKSEIDELKDRLKQNEIDVTLNREARMIVRKEELYKDLLAQNNALRKRNKDLLNTNKELISKIIKLEKER